MKLKLKINRHTTESELIHIGAFFTALGLNRGARVATVSAVGIPVEESNGDDPTPGETVVVQVPSAAGEEAPKRRRRTKGEIEAERVANGNPSPPLDAAPAVTPEPEAPAPTEPEQVPATETPAHTPDVQPQATPPSETASTAPASASPSEPEAFEVAAAGGKTYAAAEVQQLATVVARTHGADLVKGKIAELGGTRIADLKQEQLNALGTFLAGVK